MGYWNWLKKNLIGGLRDPILLSALLIVSSLFLIIASVVTAITVNLGLGAGIGILAFFSFTYGMYISG